jgi:CRP/FNR family transcriptional regulator, anaerobic regulatory protein
MNGLNGLLESVNKIARLNNDEIAALARRLHHCEFKKGQIILTEGQIENYVYYIVEGVMRNYCLKDGSDVSLDFFFTGEFTNAYISFLTREKSILNVQAMIDTKVLRIHFNDVQLLYEDSLAFNKLGRMISEQLYIKRTLREVSFITMSASERYYDLMTRHPELIQQIPQKYLSTFLGISPETLSRLRSRKRTILN